MDHSSSPIPPHPQRGRKVLDDSEAARTKREKAAERQRRKRKRDRETIAYAVQSLQQSPVYSPAQSGAPTTMTSATIQHHDPHQQDHHHHHHHHHHQHPSAVASSSSSVANYTTGDMLSMEEIRKRDKVRAAARERQRKHRQQVKMRKMRELGLEVPPNEMPHIEDIYRLSHDGHFQQVLNDLQQQPVPHDPSQMPLPPPDPQMNQGQPLGGQTFASTLLLSFSCAPLLKQHLLRTLSMTNEELASLEPILAEAWDNWDRNRRMHYAEQAAKAVASVCPPFPVDLSQSNPFPHPLPNGDPNGPSNEFRERFARSLVAPSPFAAHAPPQHSATPGPSGSGDAEEGDDAIDPHLGNGTMNPASPPTTSSTEDSG